MSPKITGMTRIQARRRVWEMIAKCHTRADCVDVLKKEFRFNVVSGEALYAEVWREIRQVDEATIPERRRVLEVTLWEAIRGAFSEKQLSVVVAAVNSIKKMYGLDAPVKVTQVPLAAGNADLAMRTDEDLDFYDAHGCWPEEMPKQAPAHLAKHPLDRLQ